MKFFILSKERDLIVINDEILDSSISLCFIKNQLYPQKKKIIVLNLELIKSQILLKTIEFCKYKHFEMHKGNGYNLRKSDFKNNLEIKQNLQSLHWYKNFIRIDIILLIDLLNSAHLLMVKELVELTLNGVATVFLKRVNEFRYSRNNKFLAGKKH